MSEEEKEKETLDRNQALNVEQHVQYQLPQFPSGQCFDCLWGSHYLNHNDLLGLE